MTCWHCETIGLMTETDGPTEPILRRSPRDSKPVPPGSVAADHVELLAARSKLDTLRVQHLEVGGVVLSAGGGILYQDDMLVMAMLQRSYGIVDAVIDLVDSYNLHAAAPLVRLQLDSLFRMCFLAKAPEAPRVRDEFFAGRQFRQIKDDEGKNLVDGRLKDRAAEYHPWAVPVYESTSGWIHLSAGHVGAAFQLGEEERAFTMGLPLPREVVPISLWAEILGAATKATDELLGYTLDWAIEKDRRSRVNVTDGTESDSRP